MAKTQTDSFDSVSQTIADFHSYYNKKLLERLRPLMQFASMTKNKSQLVEAGVIRWTSTPACVSCPAVQTLKWLADRYQEFLGTSTGDDMRKWCRGEVFRATSKVNGYEVGADKANVFGAISLRENGAVFIRLHFTYLKFGQREISFGWKHIAALEPFRERYALVLAQELEQRGWQIKWDDPDAEWLKAELAVAMLGNMEG